MGNQIEIFKTKDNQTEIKVRFEQETVWLDAHRIASLFTVNRPAIVKHIQNIYKSNELPENATCSILEQVAADGKLRKMKLYNLDIIFYTIIIFRFYFNNLICFKINSCRSSNTFFISSYILSSFINASCHF